MIPFLHRAKNIIICTNYKVMYSSLMREKSLERISNKRLFLEVGKQKIGLNRNQQIILLFRNPKARLESFFKNKFRQFPTQKDGLEHSQEIFLPYFNNSEYQDLTTFFNNYPYERFVFSLPETHRLDNHLIPQSESFSVSIKKLKIKLNIDYHLLYRIDSEEEMNKLKSELRLDLKITNSTDQIKESFKYTDEMNRIIESIYSEDMDIYKSLLGETKLP